MQYLIKISYIGTNYYGWAPQKNVPTISETIQEATKKVFNKKLQVFSSGRTDRYVHAIALPVLLKGDVSIPVDVVMTNMNKHLPEDIRVNDISLVDDEFQVRFGAKTKKYRYLIDLGGKKDQNHYFRWTYPFNLSKFKKMSEKLIGTRNFASFTARENYVSFFRTINSIDISLDGDVVIVDVIGEGFMRFMVRNIVGGLLSNNRGVISDEEFNDWLFLPEKGKVHYKAPGSGLYLVEVCY